MITLRFIGKIKSGIGKHSRLKIPGRNELEAAPSDWPAQLFPGSLNIGINEDGYPPGFSNHGPHAGVKKLDTKFLAPAFVIQQHQIVNNELVPTADCPERGIAQVWRAELQNLATGAEERVWVLRRIGSRLRSELEIVSEVQLRPALRLSDGTPVTVKIEAGDQPDGENRRRDMVM